jgi:hypothetical protein
MLARFMQYALRRIGFKDNGGKDQVAVLELGKDIVRITLLIMETRSDKKIEDQGEDARRSARPQAVIAVSRLYNATVCRLRHLARGDRKRVGNSHDQM